LSRKGVASVIATLLLVAITTVGGTITWISADNIIKSTQISGVPNLEFLEILGYDSRDVSELKTHKGTQTANWTGGDPSDKTKTRDERIAVYIKNNSVKKTLIKELSFGGTIYSYTTSDTLTPWNDSEKFVPGQYAIIDSGSTIKLDKAQIIEPGQEVTVILDLDSGYKFGRAVQFRITTDSGVSFIDTIVVGEHKF
jgi:flagellin-like protein